MQITGYEIENGALDADIMLSLHTLLGIVEGTQPLERGLGISPEITSLPVPVAQNMITLDLIEKIEKYEPRIEVTGVTFSSNTEGNLTAKIAIRLKEGTDE